jgi:phospholipid/cholesterol/gamma-HCH transport system substrate-binding protein
MRRPELKSFRDRNQVVVGIVGTLLIIATVAAVFAVGTAGILEDRYQLTATFTSTGGLATGADVRVAGVPVGEVTGIEADFDRGVVVVTFEVDEGIDLGPRTTAEIAAATLLGGYYLRLDGPVTEPHLAALDPDDERRQIPLSRTTGPTSLNDVLEDTTETVTAIDFGLANRVVDQVAGAAERNADTLPALIDDVASISVALAARDAEVRRLAESAEKLTATLAERDQELAQLVDTSDRFLGELAARRDVLSTILSSGAVAAGEASEVLVRHRDAIDAIIADTDTITGELADTLPVINDTLTRARTLFPLVVGTLDPSGGFSVRGEGILVHPGQLENIVDVVQDLLSILGVQP